MAKKKATARPLYEKGAMAEQYPDFIHSCLLNVEVLVQQALVKYGKELQDLFIQIIKSSSISNKELCYNYLESAIIGLMDREDDVIEFQNMAKKLINCKEIDFLHFLELFVDGADKMSGMQIGHYNQKRNKTLLQDKESATQNRSNPFIRCFQTARNIEIEKKYVGKGQGSGCAQVWNNCHCLQEHTSEQTFRKKYSKWKILLSPETHSEKISELVPCTWNGIYCK